MISRSMDERMDQLINSLERVGAGEDISLVSVKALRFDLTNDELGKAALGSWWRLVHFATDADLRAKDPNYDDKMRQEMAGRADELKELRAGDAAARSNL